MYRYYSTVGYFRIAAAGGKSIRNCGVIHTVKLDQRYVGQSYVFYKGHQYSAASRA
jgi:hypothetical protein